MKRIKITHNITVRDDQMIDKYFNDVTKVKISDISEEELGKRIQEGDDEALNILVKNNLRFVISVAKRYQGTGVPLVDIINEGNIGLLRAAKKFDYSKGFKFISFAVFYIRDQIMQSLDNSRSIRIPSNRKTLNTKFIKFAEIFEQKNLREPNVEEIAAEFNLEPYVVSETIESSKFCSSLDKSMGNDDDAGSLLDVIENKDADYDHGTESNYLKAKMYTVIRQLKPNEREIMTSMFGLNGDKPMDNEALSEKFKLSEGTIQNIRQLSLKKMRHFMTKNKEKLENI